jgi:hypothetical protein
MTRVTYHIVQHDGGWAYRVDETFSETFSTHELAREAAELAAREQVKGGATVRISYEDKQGHWHKEMSPGEIDRRPTSRARAAGERARRLRAPATGCMRRRTGESGV